MHKIFTDIKLCNFAYYPMRIYLQIIIAFTILLLAVKDSGANPRNRSNSSEMTSAMKSSFVPNLWIKKFAEIERWVAGMRPTVTSRSLAYISIGAYEVVLPSMNGYRSNQELIPGLKLPTLTSDKTQYNWNIALNTCYAKLDSVFLLGALPIYKAEITHLKDSINAILKPKVSQVVFDNSVAWGLAVANEIWRFASTDKVAESERSLPYPSLYNSPDSSGVWIGEEHGGYKPFTPNWGNVRRFTSSDSNLDSPPPPAYSTLKSSQYYKEMYEVYNDWKSMDYDKRWVAEFWSDDIVKFTFGPSTRIFVIAQQLSERSNMPLEETLHMYCKLGIGLNDATSACWKSKYNYNTERPWQYIRTHIDSNFRSIMGESVEQAGKNPPFPSYPSGHSVCAGVSEYIFTEFFGPQYEFVDSSHAYRTEFNGSPRKFYSFKQAAEENAYSRIPMGVHIRSDCEEGLRIGRLVGMKVNNYQLKLN